MKKILTFLIALSAILSASAQSGLRFVDANGTPIADGTTLTMSEAEEDFFGDINVLLKGIWVQNTTSSDISASLTADVKSIPSGTFACCLGSQCKEIAKTGTLTIDNVTIKANDKSEIVNTEWKPTPAQYGTCEVTLQLGTADKITVNFVYADPSAITSLSSSKKVVAYYTLDGKQISSPLKGITLVRYNDGSIKKISK